MSRISRGAAVALVLLAVGGCSSAAVDGQGSVASGSSPSITSFPSSSPVDTGTSTPTGASSPASRTPTRTATPPSSKPALPALRVCPSRSKPPFCYTLPKGFDNFSYLHTYGKGWMYKTLVSAGRHDLIEVLGSREKHSYDRLDGSALQNYFHHYLRARPGRYSVRHAGPARRTSVDGDRAFEQHVVFTDGVHGDTTTVFRGRTVVSISCQSESEPARVATACGAVHRSIRIG